MIITKSFRDGFTAFAEELQYGTQTTKMQFANIVLYFPQNALYDERCELTRIIVQKRYTAPWENKTM